MPIQSAIEPKWRKVSRFKLVAAKTGHNKESRHHLKQVGLAMAAIPDAFLISMLNQHVLLLSDFTSVQ